MLMDANKLGCGSQTQFDLARKLHPLGHYFPGDNIDSGSIKGRAAVLICIFEGAEGDLRVILTKRSSTLFFNSGEVVLPGGKMEKGDRHEVETALRVAKEEIGLDPSLLDVVAVLETVFVKKGPAVVPVVGLLHDRNVLHPTPNSAEVEAVLDVPLEMFLKNEHRREVEMDWKGEKGMVSHFDYEAKGSKCGIFGFTAGVLTEAASVVYKQSPAFVNRMHWRSVGTSKL